MKRWLFMIGSLITVCLSTTLVLAEVETSENEFQIDIQDNLASINDLVVSLGGLIEVGDDLKNFTYYLEDLSIAMDLSEGYCIVNNELTPYLLIPSVQDPLVLNITYFKPVLNQNEVFVPIQFLERHFDIKYEDGIFNYYGKDIVSEKEDIEEQEEIEAIVEKEEIIEEWEEIPVITPNPNPKPQKPTTQPEAPISPPIETPAPEETPNVPPVETPSPEESPNVPPVETPSPEETPNVPPAETPSPEETPNVPPVETPSPEESPNVPPVETPSPEESPNVPPVETPSPEEKPSN